MKYLVILGLLLLGGCVVNPNTGYVAPGVSLGVAVAPMPYYGGYYHPNYYHPSMSIIRIIITITIIIGDKFYKELFYVLLSVA